MPDSILDWGIELILSLQNTFSGSLGFMELVTLLGHEYFFFFVLPIFFWVIDIQYGLRLAIFIGVTNSINLFFKVILNDPRPYWYDTRVEMLAPPETGFGIPSGHAQNAVVVWWLLASYLRRKWALAVAVLIIFLVGMSRMFLAAHFPTDVFTGWALGILILLIGFRYEKQIADWFGKFSIGRKIGIMFGIALAAILLNALLNGIFNTSALPLEEWTANASLQGVEAEHLPAPFSLNGIISTGMAIFAIVAGYFLLFGGAGYSVEGPVWQRILRVVVGLVGVLVLMFGLDIPFSMIAPDDATLLGILLRCVRYGAVGFWIGYLAPVTFIKLKLAETAK